MTEPSEAWAQGEQRRTRTIAVLASAVAFLAVIAVGITGLALEQRARLTVLGTQNSRIDESVTEIKCLIVEQAVLLVRGVNVLLDDDDQAAVADLQTQLEHVKDVVEGSCIEAQP